MRRSLFFAFLVLTISFSTAFGQDDFSSSRLSNFANDLKRDAVDLAERAYSEVNRSSTATRATIEEAFLAQQVDAAAGLFQQMVDDRRRAAELRDAAAILTDLSRRAPSYGSNSYLWRNVQDSVGKITRELGGSGGSTGGGNQDNRPVVGRVYWKGTVDDKIQLVISGGAAEVRTLSGRDYGQGNFNFTAAMPGRNLSVGVDKKKGRGNARVVQQPTKSNGYTAIVEVYDSGSGAKEYELDVYWR